MSMQVGGGGADRRRRTKVAVLVATVVLLVAAGGCDSSGGDDSSGRASSSSPSPSGSRETEGDDRSAGGGGPTAAAPSEKSGDEDPTSSERDPSAEPMEDDPSGTPASDESPETGESTPSERAAPSDGPDRATGSGPGGGSGSPGSAGDERQAPSALEGGAEPNRSDETRSRPTPSTESGGAPSEPPEPPQPAERPESPEGRAEATGGSSPEESGVGAVGGSAEGANDRPAARAVDGDPSAGGEGESRGGQAGAPAGSAPTAGRPGPRARTGSSSGPPGPPPTPSGSKSMRSLPEGTDKQLQLLAEAKKRFLKGGYKSAKSVFEKVVETGPFTGPQASAFTALAQIHIESGRPQAAVDLLKRVPERGEKLPHIHLIRARAYADLETFDRAIAEFERVLEMRPDYVFVYPSLGALYKKTGQKKKADELYARYKREVRSLTQTATSSKASAGERMSALDLLSMTRDPKAIQAVVDALDAKPAKIRGKAISSVVQMNIRSARSKLKAIAKNDENKYVRQTARRALGALSSKGGK
ncbi:MAG: tetratricopeptide repeat protein [Bradymonadaceae bacterium]